jgi:putative sterol carrier protein
MSITIKDIFEAMPGRFNSDAAGEWNANIQFNFSNDNGGENWFVSIADGACNVGEGNHDAPTATIDTASDTWIGMISGSINPMQAFMGGQIKITGNMADVMKLQNPQVFATA